MGGADAGALAVHSRRGSAKFDADVLDAAAGGDGDPAAPALLEAAEQVIFHLHVPGEVVLAALEDGAGRADRVAAALQLHRVEEGTAGHVVTRVDLAADVVARPEVDDAEGPGADRPEIRRGLARTGAPVGIEVVAGQDEPPAAAEDLGPERRRLLEDDLHRVVRELLDALEVSVRAEGGGGGGGVGRVLPGEHHVVGAEWPAVVPGHASLEAPGDPRAVPGHPAVLRAGQFGGEDRDELAIGVEGGQGLVEEAGRREVLHAHGEMGVEAGGRLPVEELERAAAAPAAPSAPATPGDCARATPGAGSSAAASGAVRPERGQGPDEPPPTQPPRCHVVDPLPQLVLVHRAHPPRRNVKPVGRPDPALRFSHGQLRPVSGWAEFHHRRDRGSRPAWRCPSCWAWCMPISRCRAPFRGRGAGSGGRGGARPGSGRRTAPSPRRRREGRSPRELRSRGWGDGSDLTMVLFSHENRIDR